ncbi:hypothetical protein PIB30_084928 [Stylosanthes scabra]|uniref:Uncharacterized protein n=1 Tax=Stylosanthes scabra TaxID=79078 RepID=A0ABU6TTE4_9FABA|nr:hypothetical protein [Stylosanthes scabra]
MGTHPCARRVVIKTPLCVRIRCVDHFTLFTHTLHSFLPNLPISLLKMAPKGKAKVHQPPIRFSLRLAALKTRQSRDKAGPSHIAPINAEPIEISSDSESEEVPEYIPGTGQSDDEEVPEYIPEDGRQKIRISEKRNRKDQRQITRWTSTWIHKNLRKTQKRKRIQRKRIQRNLKNKRGEMKWEKSK